MASCSPNFVWCWDEMKLYPAVARCDAADAYDVYFTYKSHSEFISEENQAH